MEGKGTENGLAAMAACYKKFDPAAYLQYNYTPPRADFGRKDSIVPWKLACLHRAFNEGERIGGLCTGAPVLTQTKYQFLAPQCDCESILLRV